MKKILMLLQFLFCCIIAYAQSDFVDIDMLDGKPSFVGGRDSLETYLKRNLKYPVIAEENEVQGKVIMAFVVEPDGLISDVKVIKSVDPSLDKEGMRLIQGMPRWNPGRYKGKNVRTKFVLPLNFQLKVISVTYQATVSL